MMKQFRIVHAFSAMPRVLRSLLLFSIALFIFSMTQPAFFLESQKPDAWSNSLALVLLGGTALLGGGLVEWIIWLANPLWAYSLIILIRGRNKRAVMSSSLAFLLAMSFYFLPSVLANESGTRAKVASYGVGYVLWVCSMATLSVVAISSAILTRKPELWERSQNKSR
jgi:hypothetical protein